LCNVSLLRSLVSNVFYLFLGLIKDAVSTSDNKSLIVGWLVNSALERIRREAVVAKFWVTALQLPGGAKENF